MVDFNTFSQIIRLFKISNQWLVPDGALVILFPSRIAPFKGHITLLKALAILKKEKNLNFVCLMVGVAKKDSNYEKEISSIIEKNQLIENIRFPGICTDMPAAYKISDIVVSPETTLFIPASLKVVIPFFLACSNSSS